MSLKAIFTSLLALTLFGCSDSTDCNCLAKNEVLLQEAKSEKITASLTQVDNGAFGYTVNLKVCEGSNGLIEAVSLRGEDYLPAIDSIAGSRIYLHYSLPTDGVIRFEDVALGDALIAPQRLKYSYIVKNRK